MDKKPRSELIRSANAGHAADLLKIIARTVAVTQSGTERASRLQAHRRNRGGKLTPEQAQEYVILSTLRLPTEGQRLDMFIENAALLNPETIGHTLNELLVHKYVEWGWKPLEQNA